MAILISAHVPACDTNSQGDVIRKVILEALDTNEIIELDFQGIPNVTSSFVNSAFIELLPIVDIAAIKSRIRITRVNRQIGSMINARFKSETRAGV